MSIPSITLRTRKRLWQRTGNRCAKCKNELHEDATEQDDPSIVGEEAHIAGEKEGSARYDDPLPLVQRNEYHNILILCNRCHKIVDDQENSYPADLLRTMKADHEQWVRDALGSGDPSKERDELNYAGIVDEWVKRTELDRWEVWGSYVLGGGGQPGMSKSHFEQLRDLKNWLFGRVWPHRHPALKDAFENFRLVLHDFLNSFIEHAEEVGPGGEMLRTAKFYKRGGFVQGEYALGPAFEHHVELVRDLFIELTRAANYVCDRVRETISPTFRIKEGLVIVSFGPTESFGVATVRTEYRGDERTSKPYPGLERFYEVRASRDYHFDEGPPPKPPEVAPDSE